MTSFSNKTTLSRSVKQSDTIQYLFICMTFFATAFLLAITNHLSGYSFDIDAAATVDPLMVGFTPLAMAGGCVYLLIFIRACLRSHHPHPTLASALCDFFTNKARLLPAWVFYVACGLFVFTLIYAIYYVIFMLPVGVLYLQDMDLATLTPLHDAFRLYNLSTILCVVMAILTALILMARPATISPRFYQSLFMLAGCLTVVTPFLILCPVSGLAAVTLFNHAMLAATPTEVTQEIIGFLMAVLFPIYIGSLLILFRQYKKTAITAKRVAKDIRHVCYHSVAAAGFIFITYFIFLHSIGEVHASGKEDEISVTIKGTTLRINQHALLFQEGSTEEERATEKLVEAALGIHPLPLLPPQEGILSANYTGDQEEALRLVAHITLMQAKNLEQRKPKLIEALMDHRHYVTTQISLTLALKYSDWHPLSHQQRTLENIVAGRYQEAVNTYLEDALNNSEVRHASIATRNGNVQSLPTLYSGYLGSKFLPSLMQALVRNKLATFDFSAIHDETRREQFKDILESEDILDSDYVDDPFTEAQVQYWVKLFKLPPLSEMKK